MVPGLQATNVVMMQNNALDLARVADIVGRDRTFFGFPGVGGYRRDDGAISYVEIPRQPTTLGQRGGQEEVVAEVLKSAGFAVATTADMEGWLKTHGVLSPRCAPLSIPVAGMRSSSRLTGNEWPRWSGPRVRDSAPWPARRWRSSRGR
jgi:hypothetical protein